MNPSAKCPHCGESLPPILDAFCPNCQEPLENGSLETPAARHDASSVQETKKVASRIKNNASESISGSKTLGYLAFTGAIVVALVFCGLAAFLMIPLFADLDAREPAETGGSFFGGLYGVGFWMVIGIAIAGGLYAFARRQLDPANYSRRGRMKQIIDATNDVPTDAVTPDNPFANCSDIELLHHFRQNIETNDNSNLAELAYEARKRIDA